MKDFTCDYTDTLHLMDSGVTMSFTAHFSVPAWSIIKAIEEVISSFDDDVIGDDYNGEDMLTDVESLLFDELCAGDIPFLSEDMDASLVDWIDEYLRERE